LCRPNHFNPALLLREVEFVGELTAVSFAAAGNPLRERAVEADIRAAEKRVRRAIEPARIHIDENLVRGPGAENISLITQGIFALPVGLAHERVARSVQEDLLELRIGRQRAVREAVHRAEIRLRPIVVGLVAQRGDGGEERLTGEPARNHARRRARGHEAVVGIVQQRRDPDALELPVGVVQ
jgi:hypothetical protein